MILENGNAAGRSDARKRLKEWAEILDELNTKLEANGVVTVRRTEGGDTISP